MRLVLLVATGLLLAVLAGCAAPQPSASAAASSPSGSMIQPSTSAAVQGSSKPFVYENRTASLVSVSDGGDTVNPMANSDGTQQHFSVPVGQAAIRIAISTRGTLPLATDLHMQVYPAGCAKQGSQVEPCATTIDTKAGQGLFVQDLPNAGDWSVYFYLIGPSANQVTYDLSIGTQG